MPTYDYKCSGCDNIWDRLLKIADMNIPVITECPFCKEVGKVRRMVSPSHFNDPTRLGMKNAGGEFKDLLKLIHNRTPGSNLDKSSTITKI